MRLIILKGSRGLNVLSFHENAFNLDFLHVNKEQNMINYVKTENSFCKLTYKIVVFRHQTEIANQDLQLIINACKMFFITERLF